MANLLAEKQGINKKEAELFVRGMFDVIEEALATDKYVKVKGLGTFKLTEVDSRESVNVNTGERFEIQGHTKISFTPDSSMKELINRPFSHFETVILNDGVELDEPVAEEAVIPETQEEPISVPVEKTPVTDVAPEVIVEPIQAEGTVQEEEPQAIIEEESTSVEIEESVDVKEPVEISQPDVQSVHTPILEKEEEKSSPWLIGITIILILVILFGAYWLFFRSSDTSKTIQQTPVKQEIVDKESTTELEAPKEEIKQDTVVGKVEPKTVPVLEKPITAPANERVPSLADTLDYQITGTETTYTLQKGETIIKASLKFFGTKKFWPYIVKHNQDAIKDADNIPAGTVVKIPKLSPKK